MKMDDMNTENPLPDCCFECPYFKDSVYGECELQEIWYGLEDRQWIRKQRPNWCPLEKTEGTQNDAE